MIIVAIMAIDPFALLPANSMRANIPMRDPKHAVAIASVVESIMDRAATAAANSYCHSDDITFNIISPSGRPDHPGHDRPE